MKRLFTHWLPVFLWAGMIYALSDIPSLESGLSLTWDVVFRKIAHAAEFGILAILLVRTTKTQRASTWILAGAASALYAVSDEWHQRFVPGREGNVWDLVIDIFGVCIGLLALWRFRWPLDKQKEKP